MYMTIKEVAKHFGVHEDTIRNWTDESRTGKGHFPLPVTPKGKKNLYRTDEVESYDANSISRPESPGERVVRNSTVRNKLARHGIKMK